MKIRYLYFKNIIKFFTIDDLSEIEINEHRFGLYDITLNEIYLGYTIFNENISLNEIKVMTIKQMKQDMKEYILKKI